MKSSISRRSFIKASAIGGAGLLTVNSFTALMANGAAVQTADLYRLSHALLTEWLTTLLAMQVNDKSRVDDYGGIWCPADQAVHGRVGDTIYPLMYMADQTQDHKYVDAAILLYRWMERRVSQPDGSWLNEPVEGSWPGTTVFSVIALAETLKNHSSLLPPEFKAEVRARLKKAGDYIYDKFTIEYGNINYPVTATYALSLLGGLLNEPKFTARGRELAHQAIKFITPTDGLLTGEGDPYYTPSPKGCFSVDLGYNVEESLPALVLYARLTRDQKVLDAVTRAMKAHFEFMLPDGAWDNSWGTRNYKWTYWGSRTSDGCQTAYALMAKHDPRFYKAALRNAQLWQQTTVNGLLQGGPHDAAHVVPTCVHHTFSHLKSLTTILDYGQNGAVIDISKVKLPREETQAIRFFTDVQTWLISAGDYKATVTGYDREYKKFKNGHASGGALTMLWHPKTGPILCGSMNEYQLYEAGNMQIDDDPLSMPLTPRLELQDGGILYMNISDFKAVITADEKSGYPTIITRSKLVDKNQQSPPKGDVNCLVTYVFTDAKVQIKFSYDNKAYDGQVKFILPVIAKSSEGVKILTDRSIRINREKAMVLISADQPIVQLPTTKHGRIFNFVPGFEAVPLAIIRSGASVEISVS